MVSSNFVNSFNHYWKTMEALKSDGDGKVTKAEVQEILSKSVRQDNTDLEVVRKMLEYFDKNNVDSIEISSIFSDSSVAPQSTTSEQSSSPEDSPSAVDPATTTATPPVAQNAPISPARVEQPTSVNDAQTPRATALDPTAQARSVQPPSPTESTVDPSRALNEINTLFAIAYSEQPIPGESAAQAQQRLNRLSSSGLTPDIVEAFRQTFPGQLDGAAEALLNPNNPTSQQILEVLQQQLGLSGQDLFTALTGLSSGDVNSAISRNDARAFQAKINQALQRQAS